MSAYKQKILFVEDEEQYARNLHNGLSGIYDIHPVSNAYDAREKIEGKDQFDLILLDIHLKHNKDYWGLKLLKDFNNSAPNVPVVILTGDDDHYALTQRIQATPYRENIKETVLKSKQIKEIKKIIEKYVKTTDFFCSYSRKDKDITNTLVGMIQSQLNKKVWLDTKQMRAADSISNTCKHAISQSNTFLIILSTASINSKYVRMEFEHAQKEQKEIIALRWQLPVDEIPPFFDAIKDKNLQEISETPLYNLVNSLL